ncbi:hypothetical protein PsAD2_02996 [Pseudovibrio axinellae]|uniref:Uncharacterized protein n=1 Tax=Pseudovibrio axinellae TaxID=989403 RepID=A0A165XFK5_9HYPH|nr:hypothetical protein [Pseudovibrio axinellae]KZL17660.1 hypothetical protein PsAD2_02996 [Pseudovibrio axinellae]SER44625.1 hypothetical protein SAMN05421798_11086 [Pseudovibrio axinellae]
MVAITTPKSFKVATGKGGDMVKEQTDFEIWMQAHGFHGKQVSAAGEAIGFASATSKRAKAGTKTLSKTDRLAMAAVRAGIPEWTPETDEEIHALGVLRQALAASSQSSGD